MSILKCFDDFPVSKVMLVKEIELEISRCQTDKGRSLLMALRRNILEESSEILGTLSQVADRIIGDTPVEKILLSGEFIGKLAKKIADMPISELTHSPTMISADNIRGPF